MPQVSAWIDELRAVFGADLIDDRIRAGLRGEPVFYAAEGGLERGTPLPRGGVAIVVDERGVSCARANE